MNTSERVVIHGAGSIGCYIGGCLAAAGLPVTYLGRAGMQASVADRGMLLTDLDGREHRFEPAQIDYRTDPQVLSEATLIIVAVKSQGTQAAAEQILRHARDDVPVLSLQNGVRNVATLREVLGNERVTAGMVPFNVVQREPGYWHCGTSGQLQVEQSALLARYLAWFERAGLPVVQMSDVAGIQWGKLLLNLNNSINALCGLPLRDELADSSFRQCLALCIEEAVQCLETAGIQPRDAGGVTPADMITLLRLPDNEYQRLIGEKHRIDAKARSSMWEDLEQGRLTEVDYLNGEVVALARTLGRDAPYNACAQALVHAAEQGGRRDWTGPELLQQMT